MSDGRCSTSPPPSRSPPVPSSGSCCSNLSGSDGVVGEMCVPDRFDRDAFLPPFGPLRTARVGLFDNCPGDLRLRACRLLPLCRYHALWLCASVFRFEKREMPFCCLARLEAAFCRLFGNTKKTNDYSALTEFVISRRNTKKGLFTRYLLLLLPEMYFALLSCTLNAMIRCHQGALSDGG